MSGGEAGHVLLCWLEEQFAVDELAAAAAAPGPWHPNAEHDEVLAVDDIPVAEGFALSNRQLRATVEHIVLWNPSRVVAEVDAKRRMLAVHAPEPAGGSARTPGTLQCRHCTALCHSRSGLNCEAPDAPWPCTSVLMLTLPYGNRPGFDPQWAIDAVD